MNFIKLFVHQIISLNTVYRIKNVGKKRLSSVQGEYYNILWRLHHKLAGKCAILKPLKFMFASLSIGNFLSQNLSIHSQITQYDIDENLAHLMALARIALERGEIERAEALLEMGVRISNDYEVYDALPYIYDILATIALASGNIPKAEKWLISAVEKQIQLGVSEDDNRIIDIKLRLSRIYSELHEDDFAEIGFRDCLNIQTKKIMDGDTDNRTGILYVNTLFWFSLHVLRKGHLKDAKEMMDRAYIYSMKIKGLSPHQEMVILYTLADFNAELENYDVAAQNLQNAILLAKGIGSADLSRCYIRLANVYYKMSAWEQAKIAAMEGSKLAVIFNDSDLIIEAEDLLQKISSKQQSNN